MLHGLPLPWFNSTLNAIGDVKLLRGDVSIEPLAENGKDRVFYAHVIGHLDRFGFFYVNSVVGLDSGFSFVDNHYVIEKLCSQELRACKDKVGALRCKVDGLAVFTVHVKSRFLDLGAVLAGVVSAFFAEYLPHDLAVFYGASMEIVENESYC